MSDMTVADPINELQRMDPETKVRAAANPKWPFAHDLQAVAEVDGTCWIAVGEQLGYLPGPAMFELGWD